MQMHNTDFGGYTSRLIEGCTDSNAFNSINVTQTLVILQSMYCCSLGLMDAEAINYNPEANTDDGSCIPLILVVWIDDYLEYNVSANTDDGSCFYLIFGCTNIMLVINYNAEANVNDSSCTIYLLYGLNSI